MAENEIDLLKVSVGYGNEFDFGINSIIRDFSYEKMNEFRSMIIVAIGVMEYMWRDERANKSTVLENKK